MDLERIQIAVRPRSGWQALDLGLQMARRWCKPIWMAWCAVYLPIALALCLIFRDSPWIAILLLWWLKPLFDRVVLHVVSQAVFDTVPPLRETLRSAGRWLRPGWFAGLTLYRFDLSRSLMLPVWQLEGSRGRIARQRRALLARRMRGPAVWLTVVWVHLETVLMLSVGALIGLLEPANPMITPERVDWWTVLIPASDLSNAVIYITAVTLLEPFYVCAGFSLYLNRRIVLEGWDIEIALRRMAQRFGTGLAAALLALTVLFPHQPAQAEDSKTKQVAQEVLKAPEFQEFRPGKRWVYVGDLDEVEPDSETQSPFADLIAWLARWAQVLGWIAAGIVIALLVVVAVRSYLRHENFPKAAPYRAPDRVLGFDVRPESLPADVRAAAQALLRAGRLREALSLLYRASLSVLIHRNAIAMQAGDTEADCLRRAAVLNESSRAYFHSLIAAWRDIAYGGRHGDAARLDGLCEQWPQHFAPSHSETAAS